MTKRHDIGRAVIQSVEKALLASPEGVSALSIAVKSKYSAASIGNTLPYLAAIGIAVSVRVDQHTNAWFHVNFSAARDALAEELLQKRRQRKREHNLARKRKRLFSNEQALAEFDRESIHRRIPAHLARPIRPAGPSSVWGLAA